MEGGLTQQQPTAPQYPQGAVSSIAQPPVAAQPKSTVKPAELSQLKKMFAEARDLTQDSRTESLKDGDYYDSKQWTEAERLALRKRKQPDIVINRIKPAVNGILGVVQRGKSEPRCWPRTPQDEDSSDVATDSLRYIAEQQRFDQLKIQVFKDVLVPGTGAAIVEIDDDQQVTIQQIRWEEFFYDPRSRRSDFKDARYLGIAKWMYADDVSALYSEKAPEIDRTVADGDGGVIDESFQDRPLNQTWVDRRNRRLLVVEIYYKEGGKWARCVYHSGGILEEGESPYQDHKGVPDCPIEASSAYIDRDNNRYGVVRDMRGPQDEINKRRSKSLHLLSTRQLEETQIGAASVNADIARAEAARPDGIIPSGFKVSPTGDMASGHLQLLQEAKGEIERMGPNPAILGREGADSSGRALLARQQSGLVELAILFGELEDWELRIYRQMWARARQFWTAPMFIRVTDDEGAPQFVQLNEPQMGPPQVAQDPSTGQIGLQPTVLGYKNQVGEMDVDIIIDSTPDTANLQQEQFQDLMQLIGSNPLYAQQVPFDVLVKMSSIPHKKELLDQIKASREEQQQAQAQANQAAAQAAQAKTEAELGLTSAKTDKTKAEGMYTAVKAENEMRASSVLPMQGATGFDPAQATQAPQFQQAG